jgi:hypothetical protein
VKTGIVTESNFEYHNDLSAISKSRLAKMSSCPAYFKWCEDNPEKKSTDLIFGSAFHKWVLERETFYEEFAVVPVCDRRTKEGKALYEKFLLESEDKSVITEEEFEAIKGMCNAVESNKYAKEAEISIDVELDNEYTPYLGPNQYVYYKQDFKAVEESNLICENLETDIEKYNAIVEYISENFTYDYERAASNPGFYLGDVEGCFETRTGLCQDLAAMTACMLRVQGIPSQLVIGYADKYYHAWNKVLIDGEYQLLDITAEITGVPASVYTEDRHY